MSAYKIILSDDFIERVNKTEINYPRIRDYILGASWRLARSPKEGIILGPPLSDKYRVIVYSSVAPGSYTIWIYYKLEENKNRIIFVDINVLISD